MNDERIPVPWSFVEQTRQAYQQMLICNGSIKEEAVRKGNTMLAVKATDTMKAIQEASRAFEKFVTDCFEVITDKKYKKNSTQKTMPGSWGKVDKWTGGQRFCE